MLYLVEDFYSIQGEGRYTGVPSLFFRFGGCNMRCEGYGCVETAPQGHNVIGCDTVYAVDKDTFGKSWKTIFEIQPLINIMKSYKLPEKVDVVLTGGEPLLYADNVLFISFIKYLIDHGHRVTFETNGTIPVDFEANPVYKECIFALSVKLSNSGEIRAKRLKPKAINSITKHAKESFFKFTVDAKHLDAGLEAEISEIAALSPSTQVYCMPLGGSKREVEFNTEAVIDFCKKHGYTYSDRLHVRIWDANKGV